MTARQQRADTTPSPMDRRRLHFSAPAAASIVAVVAVAVVAAMLLFGPRGLFGFGLGPSPTPAPTAEAVSVEPSVEPTIAPTATPNTEPTPTAVPTRAPTPPPSVWTGLEWSAGPSWPEIGGARIHEFSWWNGRYVGVGSVLERGPLVPGGPDSDLRIAPAFFAAEAGSAWRLVQQGDWANAGVEDSEYARLEHLVVLGDELLAFSSDSPKRTDLPTLWSSSDGQSWTRVESDSWAEIIGSNLVAVAGSSSGVVAIGFNGGGCCMNPAGAPFVAYSPDGRTWQRISSLPMTDRASLFDVAATSAGFVIVGAARAPEDLAQMPAEVGAPAAWVSSDGLNWRSAQVDGTEVVGGRLMQVAVAADGLYATGIAEPNPFPWEGATHGWSSTDGHEWTLAGALGIDLPPGRVLVGDGERMISFGPANATATELAAWTSVDGANWDLLTFSGATALLPPGVPQEGVAGGMPAIGEASMVPGGVLVSVTSSIPSQSFWFGAAQVAE